LCSEDAPVSASLADRGGPRGAAGFEWLGGSLCLDFVNTVSWGEDGPREERLGSHRDLLGWAHAAGLRASPARRGETQGGAADAAEPALERAHELRAALHAVFLAEAEGRRTPAAAAAALGAFVEQAAAHLTLAPGGETWTFRFAGEEHPESPLWPVAWDAARLLTSAACPPVRRCANDRCRWLFLDESRRSNRRWCDMAVCGSRAKARTYYRRRKAKGKIL
jgi:predicted RNA-binding Zn ribbon-like protein